MATSIGRKALQGLAAGIGLVSEASTVHKSKKQQSSPSTHDEVPRGTDVLLLERYSTSVHELPATSGTGADTLEQQWILDEAQEELTPSSYNPPLPPYSPSRGPVDQTDLAQRFLSSYPSSVAYSLHADIPRPQLPAPVILPQRRPKNRERGFIRAYAPTLQNCGIDQAMFIDFLNIAEKACQVNPWLNAINLASIGTMWMPSVTGIAVSIAIQIATDVAIAADGRRKTNSFFDKINREFFRPRGLYCLVMTWNPELLDAPATVIDLNSLVSKAAKGGDSDMLSRLHHRFKSSDGKTYGNMFPEVAPLIFPQIDQLDSDRNAGEKVSKMKKGKEFVGEYLDKRARAKFTAKNPTSHLNQGPKPAFTSRYADPTHPASSGDPLAFVTGGRFTTDDLPRRQTLQSRFESRGLSGVRENYQIRENSRPNAPAPHTPPWTTIRAIRCD
ncbi:uncharacterized protein N7469_003180 [Penicillium citrinum]|uniref:Uncharacterized protein n=1 Tax=Penicillium citrinum TaxID=5077 RepID=A0A9W9PBV9_PENCI|nr:uncharacterized protein N7469_003180 [Penicillium citrinum]KAJ5241589.1 hypothetical protein N7469_003180 [Penicillium citrinum]